ncbi:hypothetical protein PI124_g23361 [Phytophthora idaei]|nr:hypothetical protein PI124_g23361 [Phytophthora idaei]
MMQLFCAIVGEAGTFPVDVDQNKSVGHLKKAIKAENSGTITCDAKDLQLFLAKKNSVWLRDDNSHARGYGSADRLNLQLHPSFFPEPIRLDGLDCSVQPPTFVLREQRRKTLLQP